MYDTDPSDRHRTRLSSDRPTAPKMPRAKRTYYTEAAFDRMLRRERAAERTTLPPRDQLREATDYLRKGVLDRSVAEAHLSEQQRQIVQDRVDGCSWEEISKRQGHSIQCASSIFRGALKKIRRTLRLNPLRGLAWVYRQEVSRFAPRGPKKP